MRAAVCNKFNEAIDTLKKWRGAKKRSCILELMNLETISL